jgi:hypothetical protein
MAVLCQSVRDSEDSGSSIDLIGVVPPEGIIVIDEGPASIELMCAVRVFAETPGQYPLTVSVLLPSGRPADEPIQWPAMTFSEPETSRDVLVDVIVETEEEGLHWVLVSVGQGSLTKVPLAIQWAADSRRAR